ncbi:hypothetical protein RHMOL_Rhmol06G0029400 [Rhododendron molle]|uniref:Uncharacterized protein n=1 Tax=Rhododendron molle TaxID=49168 RepID=A0ACC0N886_RHOML|nr:hypothetical protein RHMOL_Rhmol06G0029400 [Rhododendron molle]
MGCGGYDSTIMCRIWMCRNDAIFNEKRWTPDVACRTAIIDAVDFLKANEKVETSGTSSNGAATGSIERWKKPRQGWMKVNFDGGLDLHKKCGGLGVVIRDSDGVFRAARAIHLSMAVEPLMVEAMSTGYLNDATRNGS